MSVELRRAGLHLCGSPLALDAQRKTPLSFVSHGHSDHIGRHDRVIATAATLRFMEHRLGKVKGALSVPYHRPFDLGPLVLELLPAGHILGSAQLRVTLEDGTRVVYTGDFNPVPSMTAEPLEVAECDVLVTEATFGHPRYVFPPKLQVLDQLAGWVQVQLDSGIAPVLLGYPLGKSQEVMKFLASRGFKLVAHESIFALARIYGELGCAINQVRRFDGKRAPDEVALFTPHAWRRGAGRALRPASAAVLTGWALDPGAAQRYGADLAFPISDHVDFPGLLSYAKATGASEVITHGTFADDLAQALSLAGMDARPLGSVKQLSLFDGPAAAPRRAAARRPPRPPPGTPGAW